MLDLKQLVSMPQSGCFIIQLPRRVLRVYWLGYLPGSVFQEQAPSCVLAFRPVGLLGTALCSCDTRTMNLTTNLV